MPVEEEFEKWAHGKDFDEHGNVAWDAFQAGWQSAINVAADERMKGK